MLKNYKLELLHNNAIIEDNDFELLRNCAIIQDFELLRNCGIMKNDDFESINNKRTILRNCKIIGFRTNIMRYQYVFILIHDLNFYRINIYMDFKYDSLRCCSSTLCYVDKPKIINYDEIKNMHYIPIGNIIGNFLSYSLEYSEYYTFVSNDSIVVIDINNSYLHYSNGICNISYHLFNKSIRYDDLNNSICINNDLDETICINNYIDETICIYNNLDEIICINNDSNETICLNNDIYEIIN